jgi:hypothetical protein
LYVTDHITRLFFASAFALAACRTVPMPGPRSPELGGLAIRVKTRAPVRIISQRAEQVLFVRLAGPGGSVLAGEPMPSNYAKDGYLYLLNAPPGAYVAVACFRDMEPVPSAPAPSPGFSVTFQPGPTNYTTYFPEDMIRATQATLTGGCITFVGEFVVDQHLGLDDADPTQRHFYAQFGAGDEDESFMANAFGGDYHYRGSLHESATDARACDAFHAKTESRTTEAGWSLGPQR